MALSAPKLSPEQALKKFGFDRFRAGQREAIDVLVESGRLLLVAPTGGGKSLSYQIPALMFEGTTIVVSPLIALMQDQVAALEARGIAATYLASNLSGDDLRVRLQGIERGDYRLVYVAPERLGAYGFRDIVRQLKVPLIAVDEAHCISEWGHDFRPEYAAIGDFVRSTNPERLLACTATATPVVRDEIVERVGMHPNTQQMVHGFSRPNLSLRAQEVLSTQQRQYAVDQFLREQLKDPRSATGSVIVYSPTRKKAEAEALRLLSIGWKAAAYHAGLESSLRDQVQRDFVGKILQVVVATNAFGMGIDRDDVRGVIHLAPPGSIESYYQEVGRAGRDGADAAALLLYQSNDVAFRRRLIEMDIDGRAVSAGVIEHKWSLFLELLRWTEGAECRQGLILRYFRSNEASSDGCGRCDICLSGPHISTMDPTEQELIVRKLLSGVARVHGQFGMTIMLKLVRGKSDERLSQCGLNETSTFGILRGYSEELVKRALMRCIGAGLVSFSGGERPVLCLSRDGHEVMVGKQDSTVQLPPGFGGTASVENRSADGWDQDIFERLRAYRLEVATDSGVPPYVVASDRTLKEMARLRPTNERELLRVHGFGPSRVQRYGSGFLELLRD